METKIRTFLKKVTEENKMSGRQKILLVFLVGLLLFVIALPSDKKKAEERVEEEKEASISFETDLEQYREYLERRVGEALSYVEGVGKAEVVITMKSTAAKVVEKDTNASEQVVSEEDSSGGVRNTKEDNREKQSVYVQESDGTQIPYVSKEMTPEIEGVVVVAQGGGNAVVVQNITEAIQALFGVEPHKIKIMKRTDTSYQ